MLKRIFITLVVYISHTPKCRCRFGTNVAGADLAPSQNEVPVPVPVPILGAGAGADF